MSSSDVTVFQSYENKAREASGICLHSFSNRQEEHEHYLGSEVLIAVVMKSVIFWDITPCSPLKDDRYFGGTYRRHLQDRRIIAYHLISLCFLAQLILRRWRWSRHIPLKRRLTFNGLHGVISQKITLYVMNTAQCLFNLERTAY
jgi:hypothetical protein